MLMEKIMISKAVHFSNSPARYFWLFQGSSSVMGVGNTERWRHGLSKLFTDSYERETWNQSVNVMKRIEPHLKNRDCSENWEMNLVCWGLRKTPQRSSLVLGFEGKICDFPTRKLVCQTEMYWCLAVLNMLLFQKLKYKSFRFSKPDGLWGSTL